MNKIWIIGLGPGHEDYILPIAKRKIWGSDIIIGGQRHLESVVTEAEKKCTLKDLDNYAIPVAIYITVIVMCELRFKAVACSLLIVLTSSETTIFCPDAFIHCI